ncbi:MAG: hypothetical protein PVJ80_10870 [Gemmatimonadota bacterium]|jgi:hypothetical protein
MVRPRSIPKRLLSVLCAALASACAGGGGGVEDMGMGSVEMQFWNRSDETMIVFARWGNAPRVRLGQISAGRRATYQTGVRGPTVAISWDIVSATPPPGTGVGFFPRVADAPTDPQCPVDIVAGERVEWTIGVNAQSCSYLRLDPAF